MNDKSNNINNVFDEEDGWLKMLDRQSLENLAVVKKLMQTPEGNRAVLKYIRELLDQE